MTPIRKPLPVDKQSPLQRAKMAEHIKNRMMGMITGGPRTVPRQTLVGTPSGKPMANDSFIQAIAAGPQPNPLSGAKMGGIAMKKGGKVKCMSKGGSTASKRADGCATKGKTKGRII